MENDDTRRLRQLRELGVLVERLATSDGWKAMLKTASRFHEYSVGNIILIWSQKPDATKVAGYRTWQKLGRQVNKGEKGIKILAPMLLKTIADDGEETSYRRFKAVSVFDISQTSGAPLPDLEADSVWNNVTVPDYVAFTDLVEKVTTHTDMTVTVIPASLDGAGGWFEVKRRAITVVEATPEKMVRVLLHELGHAHDPALNLADRQGGELVAESSAWLAGQTLGIEMTDPTCAYLASWKGTGDHLLELADRVLASCTATERLLSTPLLVGS